MIGLIAAASTVLGSVAIAPAADAAPTPQAIANKAISQIGKRGCDPAGSGYDNSCTGTGAGRHVTANWCALFARWVWHSSGVSNYQELDSWAYSFYAYGQKHNTLETTPHVGDAVVFDVNTSTKWASHVGIVTKVNSNGTIQIVNGNFSVPIKDKNGKITGYDDNINHTTVQYSSGSGKIGTMIGGETISRYVKPMGLAPAPAPSMHTFYLRNSNSAGSANLTFPYGIAGDIPIVGDWNGDGKDTVGVFRPSNHTFYLRNANSAGNANISFSYGIAGDVPLAGDWNGDGKDTIGVYRPSNQTFYLRNSNSAGPPNITFRYGSAGDKPIVGDWNGDHKDTIGVFRPSNQTFYLRNSNSAGAANITARYGQTTDIPVVGDWNGDGKDTIGVYRPSMRTFCLRNSNTPGDANYVFQYGAIGDKPLVGDWNGDHKDTVGVYRP